MRTAISKRFSHSGQSVLSYGHVSPISGENKVFFAYSTRKNGGIWQVFEAVFFCHSGRVSCQRSSSQPLLNNCIKLGCWNARWVEKHPPSSIKRQNEESGTHCAPKISPFTVSTCPSDVSIYRTPSRTPTAPAVSNAWTTSRPTALGMRRAMHGNLSIYVECGY